jgi:hypothetical protein
VTRPRAAHDFATIRERMKELRRETAAAPPAKPDQPPRADTPLTNHERRLKDRRDGLPPHWVPTIFLAAPTLLSPIDCGPITSGSSSERHDGGAGSGEAGSLH